MVHLNIKLLTGETITMNVKAIDTIATLKAKIQEKEGVPPDQQHLIFAGAELSDESLIREYFAKPLLTMSAEAVWFFFVFHC